MTASVRRTVIVTMAALGVAFLLVWAASTGPRGVVEHVGSGTVTTSTSDGDRTVSDDDRRPQDDASTETGRSGSLLPWVQDVGAVAAALAGLWFLGVVLRTLLERISRELPDDRLVLDLQPRLDADAGREAMTRDHERQREALAGADVRNGVVACWVLLEDAAGEAGIVRRPSETSTEFVVRFLHALDVDPRPVGRLAALYHEARFSSHPLGEPVRREAQHCLDRIHVELAGVRS